MKETNKKIILILSVLTIFLLSLSVVSATDNSTSNNTNKSQSTVDNTNQNILSQNNNSNIKGDVHISNNDFSDIKNASNTNNNTIIYLDNQTFNSNDSITINGKNLTFCGGHNIGDGQTSSISTSNSYSIFSIRSNSNITFIGINFLNSVWQGLEVQYGSLNLINCTFYNCKNGVYTTNTIVSFNLENCTIINSSRIQVKAEKIRVNNTKFLKTSATFESDDSLVNNSIFNQSSHIYTSTSSYGVVDNCIFVNSSGATANNVTVMNSKFENDDWAFTTRSNAYLKNCTFYNNTGYYGSAINIDYSNENPVNLTIDNCSFINNSALIAGGAISFNGNNLTINNSVFKDNNAKVCGGAIVIGNSTDNSINNCIFSNNNGMEYGNDVYYYDGNLILNNDQSCDVYDARNNSIPIYGQKLESDNITYTINLDNNTTTGFCLELNLPYPGHYMSGDFFNDLGTIFSRFNHTNVAMNMVYNETVNDYIKYLLVNYYGKVPNHILNAVIWLFTDRNFKDPNFSNSIDGWYLQTLYFRAGLIKGEVTLPIGSPLYMATMSNILGTSLGDYCEEIAPQVVNIFNDTLNAVNNGIVIPDHGYTIINNGVATTYDFNSIFSNQYQNFITIKTSNSTVIYDMNITKITNTPVVYKGEDTSFDIIVANNGTMTLYNVSIIEDSYDDLTYKSWTSADNWTYSFVNNKHTWTLNNPLSVNQSASITVIFSTNNSTVGDKINTVIGTSNNTDNKTANNTTKVIENNTTNPNNPENNTPNKPTPTSPDNHSNITPKEAVKTNPDTGYPIIVLIIALITILASGVRKK